MANVLFNFNSSPYPWVIWIGVALILLICRYVSASRSGIDRILQVLSRANRELGTQFPTRRDARHEFMLGPFAHPNTYCLIFDTERRRVAVSYLGFCEVHEFDYIRTWELRWIEKSIGGGLVHSNPHVLIGTSDVKRPTVTVRLSSMREGEDWDQRLGLLLDSP